MELLQLCFFYVHLWQAHFAAYFIHFTLCQPPGHASKTGLITVFNFLQQLHASWKYGYSTLNKLPERQVPLQCFTLTRLLVHLFSSIIVTNFVSKSHVTPIAAHGSLERIGATWYAMIARQNGNRNNVFIFTLLSMYWQTSLLCKYSLFALPQKLYLAIILYAGDSRSGMHAEAVRGQLLMYETNFSQATKSTAVF